jgi:hypothetical protein
VEAKNQFSENINQPERGICMKYQALALVFVFSLSGCDLTRYATHPVGGVYTLAGAGVAMELPYNWIYKDGDSTVIWIIKDGCEMRLGGYDVTKIPIPKENSASKFRTLSGLPPEKVATTLMDELRNRVRDLIVIENIPDTVDGKPGFRVTYSYDERFWPKKGLYYGFMLGNWHYHLIYEADFGRFNKELKTFEKVKDSFRVHQ